MRRWLALFVFIPAMLGMSALPDGTDGRVTSLRLVPGATGAELVVAVTGDVEWTDFTLSNPTRVVIDIAGARSGLSGGTYENIRRGGVTAVRTSQYRHDVVRVVVDLESRSGYSVDRVAEGLRVTFDGRGGDFEPWQVGSVPPLASAPVAAAPAPTATALAAQERQARRISVVFQEADIRDVLSTFAEFSGRSIVAGSGVQGSVTAEIRDQPWDIALQTILRAYGLDAQELPSGIIRVDAIEKLAERAAAEPLVTQTFRVNYVPAAELVTTLTPLKTERGSIVANPSTNTVIVTDVERVADRIASMVSQLDIRTPQVSIQAKIIFVNRTDVEELGITYDLKDSRGNSINRLVQVEDPRTGQMTDRSLISLGGNSIAALGNAGSRIVGGSLETIISFVLGRYSLVAFLDALQASELSDVQAAPLITTLDNQQAEIWVGERTPIRVVDVGTGGGVAATATAQLVETGIRLRVTPHITADRQVFMELHAERSSAQLAATDIGVTFQTQQGVTRLMVADGETAVIGGLTVSELAVTRAGIPFLMDIPYLGALFRTSRQREQKRDLLIMVTPHIIDERV